MIFPQWSLRSHVPLISVTSPCSVFHVFNNWIDLVTPLPSVMPFGPLGVLKINKWVNGVSSSSTIIAISSAVRCLMSSSSTSLLCCFEAVRVPRQRCWSRMLVYFHLGNVSPIFQHFCHPYTDFRRHAQVSREFLQWGYPSNSEILRTVVVVMWESLSTS